MSPMPMPPVVPLPMPEPPLTPIAPIPPLMSLAPISLLPLPTQHCAARTPSLRPIALLRSLL
jgi:hypothetical protein